MDRLLFLTSYSCPHLLAFLVAVRLTAQRPRQSCLLRDATLLSAFLSHGTASLTHSPPPFILRMTSPPDAHDVPLTFGVIATLASMLIAVVTAMAFTGWNYLRLRRQRRDLERDREMVALYDTGVSLLRSYIQTCRRRFDVRRKTMVIGASNSGAGISQDQRVLWDSTQSDASRLHDRVEGCLRPWLKSKEAIRQAEDT